MNRNRWGSFCIYSKEYTWTAVETNVTTISITDVKLSKQKDQLTHRVSELIHKQISTLCISPVDMTLYKRWIEISKGIKTLKGVKIKTVLPRYLPKRLPLKKPSNGSNNIKISIYNDNIFHYAELYSKF